LIVLLGYGTRNAELAGLVMLLAHATFKAALFLTVGMVEHLTGTRDLRRLSGLGRRYPVPAALAALAAASMAGLPPLVGYLGHEAYFDTFYIAARHGDGTGGWWTLAALTAGSALTVTYAIRFLWGAFGDKPGLRPSPAGEPGAPSGAGGERLLGMVLPVGGLVVATLVLGVWYSGTAALTEPYAEQLPSDQAPYHLALWHGLTPALALSAAVLAAGILLHRTLPTLGAVRDRLPRPIDAQEGYGRLAHGLDRAAVWLTRHTQVGSLPAYLTMILVTVLLVPGTALLLRDTPLPVSPLWSSALQVPLAVVVLTAALILAGVRNRLAAVVLSGAVGYGVAGIFLVQGAPDLALTQFLVETLTLVIIVLVLRGLPAEFGPRAGTRRTRRLRLVVATAVGTLMALLTMVTAAARQGPAVSEYYLDQAVGAGYHNAVNAIIVDFRALDTFGEIAVLLVTAVGVGSLIGVMGGRTTNIRPRPPAVNRLPEIAHWDVPHEQWLPEARWMPVHDRSMLLETVTRLLFPAILMFSVYLLYSGHLRPGGGFAGGLVAGQAFTLRYLMGGRADTVFAVPLAPRIVAGGGLALAAVAGLVPLAFGGEPLAAMVLSGTLPVFGHIEMTTSVVFDTGVYLLVAGVCLMLLSAVGPAQETVQEAGDVSGTPGASSAAVAAGTSGTSDTPGSRDR
ncbi:MAG TPA: hydrogen gas-evolving membrane-bound hydrogenase subunit E, partial [Streptomyces sp.]|nr:hydrogen gas-evolving membrane-bound hydrogenase subunit E [Streptomyces sp.]